MTDIMVVVALIGVTLAITVPSINTALIDARANSVMRAAQAHLRAARDHAVSQRRLVEVQFVAPNEIRSTRLEGASRQPLAATVFEYGMQFQLTEGVPDTPDVFGAASAVDFGGPTTVYFQPDGSLGDATGLPVSGTVFLGTPSRPLSARAVTVLGPTGRVQGYRWDSRAWR